MSLEVVAANEVLIIKVFAANKICSVRSSGESIKKFVEPKTEKSFKFQ